MDKCVVFILIILLKIYRYGELDQGEIHVGPCRVLLNNRNTKIIAKLIFLHVGGLNFVFLMTPKLLE